MSVANTCVLIAAKILAGVRYEHKGEAMTESARETAYTITEPFNLENDVRNLATKTALGFLENKAIVFHHEQLIREFARRCREEALREAAEIAAQGVQGGWVLVSDSGLAERILSLIEKKEAGNG